MLDISVNGFRIYGNDCVCYSAIALDCHDCHSTATVCLTSRSELRTFSNLDVALSFHFLIIGASSFKLLAKVIEGEIAQIL
jgi:hypothetical protein